MGYRIVRMPDELFISLFLTGTTFPSRESEKLTIIEGLPPGAKLEAMSMEVYLPVGQIALKFSHPSWEEHVPGAAIPELHIKVSQDATTEFRRWKFDSLSDEEKLELYRELGRDCQNILMAKWESSDDAPVVVGG